MPEWENAPVTSADLDELVALAEATSEAADRAGAGSRFRGVDIQLVAVKENASRLVEYARQMTTQPESGA